MTEDVDEHESEQTPGVVKDREAWSAAVHEVHGGHKETLLG